MRISIKTRILSPMRAGLFMVLTFAATAQAAVPELINFQGKLTDPTGKAITSVVPMVFKLYPGATGGSHVWTETQNVTPDAYGIYSVNLGEITPFDISFSTAYWMGVAVGTDGEMLPRYKMVSSAYSLYSIKSGTATYAVNSGTAAWAGGADWPTITNKPIFSAGDVYLTSTQTFSGENTFMAKTDFSSSANVGSPFLPAALTVIGTLQLVNGSQGASRVLTSDAEGLASWQVAGGGGGDVYKASTQTFTGENTFRAWTYFSSSVYITGGGIYSTGTAGGVAFSNAGTRFMWMPEKFAIRAGRVNSFEWNSNNIGDYSVAFGFNGTANGIKAVVAGGEYNTASGPAAVVAGGGFNTASGSNATVAGGQSNTADNQNATVAGGGSNLASGTYAAVAGGVNNTASGDSAAVAGGQNNTASGLAAMAGGSFNTASETYATVAGGRLNTAGAYAATVAGGQGNMASGLYGAVAGGEDNAASGNYATVAGGRGNSASGFNSFAAGHRSSSTATGTFTWADSIGAVVIENNVADRTWFKNSGGFLVTASAAPADGGMFLSPANNVGIGTITPGASSLLELASTTKGFVLPRMTQAQRDAIVDKIAGMMIYQTDAIPGLRVYDGVSWWRFAGINDDSPP